MSDKKDVYDESSIINLGMIEGIRLRPSTFISGVGQVAIMKLAKEEARRLGRNLVGTEMFLLGIIGEGTSIASEVLSNLEITMKDARLMVENLIGYGNEYFDTEIVFTKRAKRVLEKAWELAKNEETEKLASSMYHLIENIRKVGITAGASTMREELESLKTLIEYDLNKKNT